MRRLLFVQHLLRPPGGANLVAAWMLEALKREYAVTLLTWEPVDLAAIRRFYGAPLEPSDLRIITVPAPVRAVFALDPDPSSIQPRSLLLRLCQHLRRPDDICVTGDNEADFGGPGLQYVHYPALEHIHAQIDSDRDRLRPWRLLSNFSGARMRQNLTLVNSDWTGAVVRRLYGIEPITLYPPVQGIFPLIPWSERENGFVCLGRLHPHKRYEEIIGVLARVRSQIPDLHLHIVGSPLTERAADRAYYRRLVELVRANGDWVRLHEDLSRADLAQLVARHRYGIHMMALEHFGLAVAELATAGCVVFVPHDGGVVEIVGRDERLVFQSTDEAVAKIVRLLGSPTEQAEVRHALRQRSARFSTDHFNHRLRTLVHHIDAARAETRPMTGGRP